MAFSQAFHNPECPNPSCFDAATALHRSKRRLELAEKAMGVNDPDRAQGQALIAQVYVAIAMARQAGIPDLATAGYTPRASETT